MFIAGIRKFDRVRGDGWLDCPNCHEHAAQDVVDEMRFAVLAFYRFSPVARRRVMRCRRCGYRREASPEELSTLSTAGRRVARAWLVPVGLSPFIVVLVAVLAIALRTGSSASTGTTYISINAAPVLPVTLSIPSGYNHSAIPPEGPTSPALYSASSGTFLMHLRRYPVTSTPTETLNNHFTDDVGLLTNGFPAKPPAPASVTVAGQPALHSTVNYTQQGAAAILDVYAFNHDGVSYQLSFLAVGTQGTAEAAAVAPQIVSSLTFNGSETPPPSASASPEAGASSSSSATASPSASASASP